MAKNDNFIGQSELKLISGGKVILNDSFKGKLINIKLLVELCLALKTRGNFCYAINRNLKHTLN